MSCSRRIDTPECTFVPQCTAVDDDLLDCESECVPDYQNLRACEFQCGSYHILPGETQRFASAYYTEYEFKVKGGCASFTYDDADDPYDTCSTFDVTSGGGIDDVVYINVAEADYWTNEKDDPITVTISDCVTATTSVITETDACKSIDTGCGYPFDDFPRAVLDCSKEYALGSGQTVSITSETTQTFDFNVFGGQVSVRKSCGNNDCTFDYEKYCEGDNLPISNSIVYFFTNYQTSEVILDFSDCDNGAR